MSLPICHFRFSIFVLETLKFEWECSQYLEFNQICAYATYIPSLAPHNAKEILFNIARDNFVVIKTALFISECSYAFEIWRTVEGHWISRCGHMCAAPWLARVLSILYHFPLSYWEDLAETLFSLGLVMGP